MTPFAANELQSDVEDLCEQLREYARTEGHVALKRLPKGHTLHALVFSSGDPLRRFSALAEEVKAFDALVDSTADDVIARLDARERTVYAPCEVEALAESLVWHRVRLDQLDASLQERNEALDKRDAELTQLQTRIDALEAASTGVMAERDALREGESEAVRDVWREIEATHRSLMRWRGAAVALAVALAVVGALLGPSVVLDLVAMVVRP